MATEAFVIAITSTGTREVQRDLQGIGAAGTAASKEVDAMGASMVRTQKSVDALRGSLSVMRNLLVAFSFLRAISGIAEFASTATNLTNKLTTITRSGAEVHAVMAALGEVSIKTRTDLETNVDTFTRLARSTGSLKLTYQQLIDLTRGIADTVHIAGASSQQAKRALMDFAEGLAAGSLQGRQLRAMVMQLPTLGDAIAKSFGLAGAQLMGFLKTNPGALNPAAIVKALQAALPGLDAMIGKTQVSIAQGFTNLHTKMLLFMQDLDKTYGISQKVNDVLTFFGDNLAAIGKFLLTIAGLFIIGEVISLVVALFTNFEFLYGVVNVLTFGLLKMAVALLTLPFRAVIIGIELFQGAIAIIQSLISVIFGIQEAFAFVASFIPVVVTALTSAMGFLDVFGLGLAAVFGTVEVMITTLTTLGIGLGVIAVAALGAYTAIAGLLAPLAQIGSMTDPFAGMNISLKDLPTLFESAFDTIVNDFPLFTSALSALWDDMINSMTNRVTEKLFNYSPLRLMYSPDQLKTLQNYKPLPTDTAGPLLQSLAQKTANEYQFKKLGLRGGEEDNNSDVLGGLPVVQQGKSLNEADPGKVASATAAMQRFLAQFAPLAAAQAKMDDLNKLLVQSGKAHVNVLQQMNIAGLKVHSVEEARAKILTLVQREILGVGNEELKSKQQIDLLDAALKKHIITQNEYATALLKVHTAQLAASPSNVGLGIQVATEKGQQALAAGGDIAENVVSNAIAFQNATQLAAISQNALDQARAQGAVTAEGYDHALIGVLQGEKSLASGELLAKLQAEETLLDKNKIAASALATVYDKFDAGQKVAIQIQAINDALAQNPALAKQAATAIRDLQIELLNTQTDALSGFQRGLLEAQKSMNDFASTAATTVKTAFDDLTNALTKFVDTGKLNIKTLSDDLLQNLTKLAVQQTVTGPLSNLLGFGQNGQGGPFGSGGFLSSIFGGGGLGAALGGGQLGSSPTNAMWVQMAGLPTGSGIGTSGGIGDIFSSGGMFGSGGFFANLMNGGGGAGTTSSGIVDALSSIGSFLGFAGGGDMVVGGQGGTDSQMVNFKATPGEIVSVRRPGDAGSSYDTPRVSVQLHVHGVQDVDGFQRSQGQIMGNLGGMIAQVVQRNGRG